MAETTNQNMNKEMIMTILAFAAKYGIGFVVEYIKTINKDDITLEDIQGLETLIKTPEEYFK